MNTVRRNELCPCASGRRYKDCHGGSDPHAWKTVEDLMYAALAAQQNGLTTTAASLYTRVLEREPTNFDATHMLGVVQYQRGRFDEALTLLQRAKQLGPDISAAAQNFRLLESVFANEIELCRDALARTSGLIENIPDMSSVLADAPSSHIVLSSEFSEQDRASLEPIIERVPRGRLTLWRPRDAKFNPLGARVLDPQSGLNPVGGLMIFCGMLHSSFSWIPAARPERVILIVTRDLPGMLLDAIRGLSGEGRKAIALIYATSELATRFRLRGDVLPPLDDHVEKVSSLL
ncbi:MAG: tetratricopeptide repeat protein [Betaproteobacteria bacterium]